MSERSSKLLVEDMIESVEKILQYTHNLSFEEFLKQSMAREAVYRNLEVLGEAADKIPQRIAELHSGIPWQKMIGLRNILIHGYFGIDDHIVWNVVVNILPQLKNDLLELAEEL
jgi:uncharacterized protein with HEPN domain